MSQHDNGRRAAGHQSEAWHNGNQNNQSHFQQDQTSASRYGAQQGGHFDSGASRGHQDQYDFGGGQQGDNTPVRSAGPRNADAGRSPQPGRERGWNAHQGGQGSYGGQASTYDDDVSDRFNDGFPNQNRENFGGQGNFGSPSNFGGQGNAGQRRDSGNYDRLTHRNDFARGPQGGWNQGGQRFGGGYGAGGDGQRRDGSGGYGYSNDGAYNDFGSGSDVRGDFDTGSYGTGARGFDNDAPWRNQRQGQDRNAGNRGFDPDYHQWRTEQLNRLDRDYDEWRQHRYQRFSDDFNEWRRNRDAQARSGANAASTSADAFKSDPGVNSAADKVKSNDSNQAASSSSRAQSK